MNGIRSIRLETAFRRFMVDHKIGSLASLGVEFFVKKFEEKGDSFASTVVNKYPELQEFFDFLRARGLQHAKEETKLADDDYIRQQAVIPYGLFLPQVVALTTMRMICEWIDNHCRSVLDIGCGEANYLTFLKKYVIPEAECIGIEASEGVLRLARVVVEREQVQVDLRKALATQLPLADGSVEAVLFSDTLQFVREWQVAIREAARVMAPNARMFLVYLPNHPAKRVQATNFEIVAFLRQAGFEVQPIDSCGLNSLYLDCRKRP